MIRVDRKHSCVDIMYILAAMRRWVNVVDGVPTVNQRWANVSCFLGYVLRLRNTQAITIHGMQGREPNNTK